MGQETFVSRLLEAVPETETEQLLFRLIAAQSHEDAPGQENETADVLTGYLRASGILVEMTEVLDGRRNLIARLPGNGTRPSLLLNGHLDTVPSYGMFNAFQAERREGRIYGRGSVDMKGALAVMAGVLKAVQRSGIKLGGDLIFAATVGEETYSPGAFRLIMDGKPADYAIVGEPTNMEIGIAHKGVGWYEACFEGVSVHGSVPDMGINAIYRANRWIEYIQDRYIPSLSDRSHPLLGPPTLNIGTIKGGTRPVIVPGSCAVGFERRLVPGETAETVLTELRETLERVGDAYSGFQGTINLMDNFRGVPHGPMNTRPDSPVVRALEGAYRIRFGREAVPQGLQFWTDGALLGLSGTETVVCGPGAIAQAHSDGEYVEAEQLGHAFAIYAEAACTICAADGRNGKEGEPCMP